MKRFIRGILAVVLGVMLLCPSLVMADAAIGGEHNFADADYYVVVDAPDGYVNFRYGPGLEYGIDFPIYNGEILHVISTADNFYDGLSWGQVVYNGIYGWISLSQTSWIDPYASVPQQEETQPQTPEAPQPQSAQPGVDPQSGNKTGDPAWDNLVTLTYSATKDEGASEKIFAIPKINLDSAEIQELNQQIFDRLYAEIQDGLQPAYKIDMLLEATYEWYVNGDILSLVLYTAYGGPWHEYEVYNISVSQEKVLDNQAVIAAAGLAEAEYQQLARDYLDLYYRGTNKRYADGSAIYNQHREDTVSQENIEKAMPYINGDGQLSIVGLVYLYAVQNYASWMEIALTRPEAGSYYVVVDAPDNYCNLRTGPGISYDILTPIYNGKILYITQESYNTADGLLWGFTTCDGQSGWVSVNQTSILE